MAASIDTDGLSSYNIPVLLDLPMAPQLPFTCVTKYSVHVMITTIGLNFHFVSVTLTS